MPCRRSRRNFSRTAPPSSGCTPSNSDHQVEPQDGRKRRLRPAERAARRRGAGSCGCARACRRPATPRGRPPPIPRPTSSDDATTRWLRSYLLMSGSIQTPFCRQHLVVFRAGQRRQEEEFEDVERQLALDDLDVAQDRFLGVGREAEDVAGVGDGAVVAPLLQHLAVFGDLVLPLLGGDQIVGIDVLEPDEHAPHAGLRRLLDEVRDLVAQRVDLDGEADARETRSRAAAIRRSNSDLPVACCGRNCRR